MASYTEEETLTLIKLYREYCQTKQGTFELQPEDKQVFMKHLGQWIEQFNSYDSQGYVFYRRFALPYVLPQQLGKGLRRAIGGGEGLSMEENELLSDIEGRIQAECLCDIWEGQIPDVCILFASIIEAGFGARVLPKVLNNGIQINSKIAADAKLIQKQRKKDKLKAMRKHLGTNNQ